MAKLNQIIAIEKGIKSRVYGEITTLDKAIQKPDLFNGMVRRYLPKDDADEEKLPGETKRVQFVVTDVLRSVARMSTEWYDVTARKDWSNSAARADIVVDGAVIVEAVPVTYLLFLEKQLTDVRTFVDRLPVLDEAEAWTKDPNSGLYKTDPTQTHRTKKVQRSLVLIQPTVEHPGQAQLVTEDVIAGFWELIKHSGAMPKPDKIALLERVEKLLQATKQAREAANAIDELPAPKVGDAIFTYLLGAV